MANGVVNAERLKQHAKSAASQARQRGAKNDKNAAGAAARERYFSAQDKTSSSSSSTSKSSSSSSGSGQSSSGVNVAEQSRQRLQSQLDNMDSYADRKKKAEELGEDLDYFGEVMFDPLWPNRSTSRSSTNRDMQSGGYADQKLPIVDALYPNPGRIDSLLHPEASTSEASDVSRLTTTEDKLAQWDRIQQNIQDNKDEKTENLLAPVAAVGPELLQNSQNKLDEPKREQETIQTAVDTIAAADAERRARNAEDPGNTTPVGPWYSLDYRLAHEGPNPAEPTRGFGAKGEDALSLAAYTPDPLQEALANVQDPTAMLIEQAQSDKHKINEEGQLRYDMLQLDPNTRLAPSPFATYDTAQEREAKNAADDRRTVADVQADLEDGFGDNNPASDVATITDLNGNELTLDENANEWDAVQAYLNEYYGGNYNNRYSSLTDFQLNGTQDEWRALMSDPRYAQFYLDTLNYYAADEAARQSMLDNIANLADNEAFNAAFENMWNTQKNTNIYDWLALDKEGYDLEGFNRIFSAAGNESLGEWAALNNANAALGLYDAEGNLTFPGYDINGVPQDGSVDPNLSAALDELYGYYGSMEDDHGGGAMSQDEYNRMMTDVNRYVLAPRTLMDEDETITQDWIDTMLALELAGGNNTAFYGPDYLATDEGQQRLANHQIWEENGPSFQEQNPLYGTAGVGSYYVDPAMLVKYLLPYSGADQLAQSRGFMRGNYDDAWAEEERKAREGEEEEE